MGFGSAAQNLHCPLIQAEPGLQLSAVVSSQPDTVSKTLSKVPCYANLESLLDNADVDLVVIATPNDSHVALALQALQANKHVVIEKPVAVAPQDIKSLQHTAEAQGKSVFPFHNRRWDGDFLALKQLLASGKLGDLKLLESRFDRYRPTPSSKWKEQSTGLWFDLGPHLLDQAFSLMGTPDGLTARLLTNREQGQACDYFHVTLHYPSTEVVLSASNHNCGPLRRFYVQGSRGTYSKQGLDPQEQQLKAGMDINHPEFGLDSEARHQGNLFQPDNTEILANVKGQYPVFYQSVVACLSGQCPPPVHLDDAMQVARFLQMGVLSQEQGKMIKVRQFRD